MSTKSEIQWLRHPRSYGGHQAPQKIDLSGVQRVRFVEHIEYLYTAVTQQADMQDWLDKQSFTSAIVFVNCYGQDSSTGRLHFFFEVLLAGTQDEVEALAATLQPTKKGKVPSALMGNGHIRVVECTNGYLLFDHTNCTLDH